MNVTFLIGNGFDINIGMNTRYCDFYEYYKIQPSNHTLIENVKNDLKCNSQNWSDLEIALGDYTKCLNTLEEFDIVFDDIKDKLAEYMTLEQSKYSFKLDDKSSLYQGLGFPENYLPLADKLSLKRYKNGISGASVRKVNVITFNYTTTLEALLTFKGDLVSGSWGDNDKMSLHSLKHIHGLCNKNMILGVNDLMQIGNESFRQNIDITRALIKSDCNKSLKHLIDSECKNLIEKSNLICLFGLSVGDTDKNWWELIGKQLIRPDSRLVIFHRGNPIADNHEHKLIREENKVKSFFLSQANLPKEQQQKCLDRIYIGYNTDIFKIELNTQE